MKKDYILCLDDDKCVGCDMSDCQDCCPHEETYNYICVQCGKELDPFFFMVEESDDEGA